MTSSLSHLLVAPIVVPLAAAALLLLVGDRRPRLKSLIGTGSTAVSLAVAVTILLRVHADGGSENVTVYLASNWEAPFGIVLVADRLSALMLTLTGVVSLSAIVYATAAWSRAGVYFHPLFQVQLMGLNGAFLTGDLFNLFVFFEVMLAASYGLHLHGSGWPRVRSGLHYVAVNLLASTLFLIGLAMLYGITGTLSMADVARKLPMVAASDRGLLHAGTTILALAFLTKAAIWPLSFWLVPAYMAASAPVAALFALMTKVGIYTLLRLSTLFFPDVGPSAHFGAEVLAYGGVATIAFAVLGLLAALRLGRIAGFAVIVSSGTLLSAIGMGTVSVTAAALYYLLSATLAASALFLLIELVERTAASDRARMPDVDAEADEDTNLDDDGAPLVGRAIPMSLALLGLAFIACALLVAGLPPLSGFVAKFALLSALVRSEELAAASSSTTQSAAWWLFGLLLASGLATTVSLARAGIRHFWSVAERRPRLELLEGAPVFALLATCLWLTLHAEPVLRYTRATAESLHRPSGYIGAVLSTRAVPSRTPRADEAESAP